MSRFAVQAAHFSEQIYIGRTNATETAFTEKQDATDETLFAVADYVRRHFNGSMSMKFSGDGGTFELSVNVTPTTPSQEDV